MRNYSLKEKTGCLFLDIPRLLPALFIKDQWISAWNRQEALKVEQGGVDTTEVCPCSVDLHACHVFPWVGKRLMQQAIQQWPFSFSYNKKEVTKPEVSFIIPHRGKERLPESVRYIHIPHPDDTNGWYKSWAYNVGVLQAQADIVVCQDGDILVPMHYAREIVNRITGEGYEVAYLHRFLFCLDEMSTTNTLKMQNRIFTERPPYRVRQNWKGGTLAIRKNAYFRIGGFDERFTGWSGEDLEFYDRCLVLNSYRFGYIPFIHLCHPEQPTKKGEGREANFDFSNKIMSVPREQRIIHLKELQRL